MSPLDYLRAIARRQKPATGGIVRYDPSVPLVPSGGCVFPMPATGTPENVTVTLHLHEPTPEDTQRMVEALGVTIGPASLEQAARGTTESEEQASTPCAEDRLTCPCAVLYSHCYYPVLHAKQRR